MPGEIIDQKKSSSLKPKLASCEITPVEENAKQVGIIFFIDLYSYLNNTMIENDYLCLVVSINLFVYVLYKFFFTISTNFITKLRFIAGNNPVNLLLFPY